jgi:phytanoyl-CoA hydroxylase
LDDATLENGCLYFMPGSHKVVLKKYEDRIATNSPVKGYNEVSGEMNTCSYFDEIKIGKNMSDLIKIHPELAGFNTVSAPLKAGSISFHHGSLGHGAGCNMTSKWRRAMTFQFMPDGSIFNGRQNILTDEQCANLSIGDTLNDETVNPMMYRKP